MSKRSKVGEFLSQKPDPRWHGGRTCAICAAECADELNADVREFARARKRGNAMPWSVFFARYLKPEYKLKVEHQATRRHVAKCLGLEL